MDNLKDRLEAALPNVVDHHTRGILRLMVDALVECCAVLEVNPASAEPEAESGKGKGKKGKGKKGKPQDPPPPEDPPTA